MSIQRILRPGALWLLLIFGVACGAVAPGSTPSSATPTPNATARSAPVNPALLLSPESPPFDTSEWRTDFTRRTVAWSEIRSGGPPKDGIPAIDHPSFISVTVASVKLAPQEPVILFSHNSAARAYPLSILIWHEIVNDEVAGLPVAVTFCPLCNASIVFERRLGDQVLDFGTTGRLRNSDLVMYDRQTESWWQQATGEGLIGHYAGHQLTFLASQVIPFADFAKAFPEGLVLAAPNLNRSYGRNPYVNYDSGSPFLYDGQLDPRLPPTERVAGVVINGAAKAYGFPSVAAAGVINDDVGGQAISVFHQPGTASALDSVEIRAGRDVGSVAVFSRQLNDRLLTFELVSAGVFRDQETGSTWNLLGIATAGELAGQRLTPLVAFDHFWFAWFAFYPETALYE